MRRTNYKCENEYHINQGSTGVLDLNFLTGDGLKTLTGFPKLTMRWLKRIKPYLEFTQTLISGKSHLYKKEEPRKIDISAGN